MVIRVQGTKKDDMVIAEAPLARVDWKRDPGLRKLYFWAFIICIASATTGYDAYVTFSTPFVQHVNRC
jgi:hypothetical protein